MNILSVLSAISRDIVETVSFRKEGSLFKKTGQPHITLTNEGETPESMRDWTKALSELGMEVTSIELKTESGKPKGGPEK